MWNLKRNDKNELIYKTETDSQTSRTNLTVTRGKGEGEGIVREFGIDMYTLLYLFIYLFIFIWLCQVLVVGRGLLSCGTQTLSCDMHVGSSSLTRDRTRAPCIGSTES